MILCTFKGLGSDLRRVSVGRDLSGTFVLCPAGQRAIGAGWIAIAPDLRLGVNLVASKPRRLSCWAYWTAVRWWVNKWFCIWYLAFPICAFIYWFICLALRWPITGILFIANFFHCDSQQASGVCQTSDFCNFIWYFNFIDFVIFFLELCTARRSLIQKLSLISTVISFRHWTGLTLVLWIVLQFLNFLYVLIPAYFPDLLRGFHLLSRSRCSVVHGKGASVANVLRQELLGISIALDSCHWLYLLFAAWSERCLVTIRKIGILFGRFSSTSRWIQNFFLGGVQLVNASTRRRLWGV